MVNYLLTHSHTPNLEMLSYLKKIPIPHNPWWFELYIICSNPIIEKQFRFFLTYCIFRHCQIIWSFCSARWPWPLQSSDSLPKSSFTAWDLYRLLTVKASALKFLISHPFFLFHCVWTSNLFIYFGSWRTSLIILFD